MTEKKEQESYATVDNLRWTLNLWLTGETHGPPMSELTPLPHSSGQRLIEELILAVRAQEREIIEVESRECACCDKCQNECMFHQREREERREAARAEREKRAAERAWEDERLTREGGP